LYVDIENVLLLTHILNDFVSVQTGQVFAYGEYDVMYISYDRENNTAVCSFTVYVIRKC
jgi:hypothetical protein